MRYPRKVLRTFRGCGLAFAVAVAIMAAVDDAAAAPRLRVTTALVPRFVLFGDLVHADILIEARSPRVQVDARFGPFRAVGPPAVARWRAGGSAFVRYRYALRCLESRCLVPAGGREVRLPALVATAGEARVRAQWPALRLAGRTAPADASAARPPWSAELDPPAPRYDVSPGALSAGLFVAAGLLGAAAAALVARELARRRGLRTRRALERSLLERAVASAREAAARPPADRRKALGLLADALEATGERPRALSAVELAWAEPEPSPAEVEALAERVEREVLQA